MGVIVNFLMATIIRQGPGGHASSACNTVTARLDPSTTLCRVCMLLSTGDMLHELQMTPHAWLTRAGMKLTRLWHARQI